MTERQYLLNGRTTLEYLLKSFITSILCLALVGCATVEHHEFSFDDRAATEPLKEKHLECTAQNAASLIDGSNDVAYLVNHISTVCEPLLTPIEDYLLAQNFRPAFAHAYVDSVRKNHEAQCATFILKVKGGHPIE